jgi:uncharacterized protein DUF6883
MKLPNADKAVIAQNKLVLYLLNVAHRKGSGKARTLLSMGYAPENWQQLESDIRAQHLSAKVSESVESDYGMRYDIVAPLTGPSGRTIVFRSVWQIDLATDAPRLITRYPE